MSQNRIWAVLDGMGLLAQTFGQGCPIHPPGNYRGWQRSEAKHPWVPYTAFECLTLESLCGTLQRIRSAVFPKGVPRKNESVYALCVIILLWGKPVEDTEKRTETDRTERRMKWARGKPHWWRARSRLSCKFWDLKHTLSTCILDICSSRLCPRHISWSD